jgi:ankyrin repeat protein
MSTGNEEWFKALQQNDVARLHQWATAHVSELGSTNRLIAIDALQMGSSRLPLDSLTLLHIAATFDALDCFVYLHSYHGLKLNSRSAKQALPLHYAVYVGSLEIVTYILTREPAQAQDLPDTIEVHLLSLAALSRRPEIIILLFENGANPKDPKNIANNPLKYSIATGADDCSIILFDHRAVGDNIGYSPLMLALHQHHFDLSLYFAASNDEDVQFRTKSNEYAALLTVRLIGGANKAVDRKKLKDVLKLIAERQGRLDLDPSEEGRGILHAALEAQLPLDLVEYLLDLSGQGVNVNRIDKKLNMTCAACLASTAETEYHQKALELLFRKGYQKENGPHLLVHLLRGAAGAPPAGAIKWLVRYLRDQGAPIRPDDRPLMGAGEATSRQTHPDRFQNYTIKQFFGLKFNQINKNAAWWKDLQEAWEIVGEEKWDGKST